MTVDQRTVAPSHTAEPLPSSMGSDEMRPQKFAHLHLVRSGLGYRELFLILLLLGFGLRLVMLDRFRFHQDEALYSYWALQFLHDDPHFLKQWIDKPPLYIWLLAYCFQAFGASEASARLLNIGIGVLTIPVVAAMARQVWTAGAGLVAAAAYALNPFAISYGPTAFTDPLFVLAGVCSVYAAQTRRPFWAGICLGGAIMAKQQGLLFIPLTLAVLLADNLNAKNPRDQLSATRDRQTAPAAALLRLGGGLALPILPILYWDSLRWAVAPSPWDLGLRNYGALEIVAPAQWPARVAGIAELLWYLVANQVVWIVLIVALLVAVLYGWSNPGGQGPAAGGQRPAPFALLLCGWVGVYWMIHAVVSLPLWDRYFLPIAPAFAILTGWLGARMLAARSTLWRRAVIGLWIVLLLPGAVQAARGKIPIGGDHGAYDGLRETLVWLDSHSPARPVLYHQPLNWRLRFYLYENPDKYNVRWFASAVSLADDAAKMAQRPKFVIVPDWLPLRNSSPHLAARGLELIQRHSVEQFTVYELALHRR